MTAGAEQGPGGLFGAVVRNFDRAARTAGVIERWYDVMGRVVVVRFAGPALEQVLTPALGHRAIAPGSLRATVTS